MCLPDKRDHGARVLREVRSSRAFVAGQRMQACTLIGINARRDAIPDSRKLTSLEGSTVTQYILDLNSPSSPPAYRANVACVIHP